MKKPQATSTPHGKPRRTPPRVDLSGRLGLSQVECAAALGKSPSYLRRLHALGLGPRVIRAGGRGWIVPLDSLKAWMETNAIDPADTVGK